jgi:hypothetical protein
VQLAEGRARDAVAAGEQVTKGVDERPGDLLLLLRRAVHLQAQEHGQGAAGEGVLGNRSDHLAEGYASAEERDPARHAVSNARALAPPPPKGGGVPAVDLEAASPREQEAAVHVGRHCGGELVVLEEAVVRATDPVARQRLACVRGGAPPLDGHVDGAVARREQERGELVHRDGLRLDGLGGRPHARTERPSRRVPRGRVTEI